MIRFFKKLENKIADIVKNLKIYLWFYWFRFIIMLGYFEDKQFICLGRCVLF